MSAGLASRRPDATTAVVDGNVRVCLTSALARRRLDATPAKRSVGPAPDAALRERQQVIARSAVLALYEELALYPKPGLVSFVDTGSHQDMDARTFLRSLFSLRHYFAQVSAAGAAPFATLEAFGIEAERRMVAATAGVNTHRGAIFTLGLLCAAAGRWATQAPVASEAAGTAPATATATASASASTPMAARKPTPAQLRHTLVTAWGNALIARCEVMRASNGQRAARAHGLRSASQEAALGFPVLFDVAVPALQAALRRGCSPQQARLQAFLHIVATLDDTNLAHRGGLAGLRWAQSQAASCLAGTARDESTGFAQAVALHQAFVARRLSPGGAADVLAAACWVQRVCAGA